jgi:hypothetical protein
MKGYTTYTEVIKNDINSEIFMIIQSYWRSNELRRKA